MHAKAQRVQDELRRLGLSAQVLELAASTRTAVEAAAALGATPAQIAKSLLFLTEADEPVLVIASGGHRVDLAAVARRLGQPVRPADAKAVKRVTGYSIGGVPPVAHAAPLRALVDATLLEYDTIWASAGTPNAVVELRATALVEITAAEVADVAERPA